MPYHINIYMARVVRCLAIVIADVFFFEKLHRMFHLKTINRFNSDPKGHVYQTSYEFYTKNL